LSKLPAETVQDVPIMKYLCEKEIFDEFAGMTDRQILSNF
jgi:hypothetical protein